VIVEGSSARLVNRIESPVDVDGLIVIANDGSRSTIPIERRLEKGEEVGVETGVSGARTLPVYTVPRSPGSLAEIRSFIEDIAVNAVFINLVDLGALGVTSLKMTCRLRGVDGERELELTEGSPIASADFLLPLTSYLSEPVLEFRTQTASAWRSWNLGTQGSVIGLTRELVD
jgi:hypothetical protein